MGCCQCSLVNRVYAFTRMRTTELTASQRASSAGVVNLK